MGSSLDFRFLSQIPYKKEPLKAFYSFFSKALPEASNSRTYKIFDENGSEVNLI